MTKPNDLRVAFDEWKASKLYYVNGSPHLSPTHDLESFQAGAAWMKTQVIADIEGEEMTQHVRENEKFIETCVSYTFNNACKWDIIEAAQAAIVNKLKGGE